MKRFKRNVIVTLLIITTMVLVFSQYLDSENEDKQRTVINVSIENCTAQQVCLVNSDEFNIKILFDKNIYYLKPFEVIILTKSKVDIEIKSIQIDFKMKGMNMGVNRFKLSNVNSENNNLKWVGKALLPICVTGRADWFAELEVVTKLNKYIYSVPVLVKQYNN